MNAGWAFPLHIQDHAQMASVSAESIFCSTAPVEAPGESTARTHPQKAAMIHTQGALAGRCFLSIRVIFLSVRVEKIFESCRSARQGKQWLCQASASLPPGDGETPAPGRRAGEKPRSQVLGQGGDRPQAIEVFRTPRFERLANFMDGPSSRGTATQPRRTRNQGGDETERFDGESTEPLGWL